jgi:hypothetical protein
MVEYLIAAGQLEMRRVNRRIWSPRIRCDVSQQPITIPSRGRVQQSKTARELEQHGGGYGKCRDRSLPKMQAPIRAARRSRGCVQLLRVGQSGAGPEPSSCSTGAGLPLQAVGESASSYALPSAKGAECPSRPFFGNPRRVRTKSDANR